jgi:hypothetical protein
MRDKSNFTTGQAMRRSPKALAAYVLFSVFLILFRISLISMIRINSITVMNFEFHWHAMELLHMTSALLSMKENR